MSERNLMDVKPTGLPPGVTPEAVAAEEQSETPSPEEQATYDKFVNRAINFIHGEQTEDKVLAMLNQSGSPVHETVGRTAAKVVQLVQQSAQSSGAKLLPELLKQAGAEVVELLMELGAEAKVFPMTPDSPEYQEALDLAYLEGMKVYGEDLLAGPDGDKISAEAGDEYARQVAAEADRGEIDPEFAAAMQQQDANPEYAQMNAVSAGVQQAVGK